MIEDQRGMEVELLYSYLGLAPPCEFRPRQASEVLGLRERSHAELGNLALREEAE